MRNLNQDSTHLHAAGLVQSFIDNVIIESVQDISRRWHTPQKHPDPLIVADRPWEGITYFSISSHCVMRDPRDGLFKCWYENLVGEPQARKMALGLASQQLYAESADGVTWTKPELDVVAVDGRPTNIVMPDGTHCMSVVIDPYAASEEERFRAFFTRMFHDNTKRESRCAHSPNGIHWKYYNEQPSMGTAGPKLCDVTLLSYDGDAREFVQNTRHFLMTAPVTRAVWNRDESFSRPYELDNFAAYNQRRVWQSRSSDFIHWSEPFVVAATDDDEDNLDESVYGLCQYRMGGLHLGLMSVLRMVDNEMDVQLVHSRDGLRWRRGMKRQPFIRPQGVGYWDAHMVGVTSPPIEVGDELWFFHGGTDFHHDWWLVGQREGINHPEALDPMGCGAGFGLGLATLRKDGYASLYSNPYRSGIVITRPLISMGTELLINAVCFPGGSVAVEVLDRHDQVVPGCSIDECDPFTEDAVAHRMTWNGRSQIPAGREEGFYWRKLKFRLCDAELFSFTFSAAIEDPSEFKTEKEW